MVSAEEISAALVALLHEPASRSRRRTSEANIITTLGQLVEYIPSGWVPAVLDSLSSLNVISSGRAHSALATLILKSCDASTQIGQCYIFIS